MFNVTYTMEECHQEKLFASCNRVEHYLQRKHLEVECFRKLAQKRCTIKEILPIAKIDAN